MRSFKKHVGVAIVRRIGYLIDWNDTTRQSLTTLDVGPLPGAREILTLNVFWEVACRFAQWVRQYVPK